VSLLSRLAVLFAALALCLPGIAIAQTTTIPQSGAGVSDNPPASLDGGEPGPAASEPSPPPSSTEPAPSAPVASAARPAAGDELPNTGSDPRLLFLVGAMLMLFGVGLRLRTADAELY